MLVEHSRSMFFAKLNVISLLIIRSNLFLPSSRLQKPWKVIDDQLIASIQLHDLIFIDRSRHSASMWPTDEAMHEDGPANSCMAKLATAFCIANQHSVTWIATLMLIHIAFFK